MRRLLWITAIAPRFDAGGGGEIRQAHLIEALSARFEVQMLLAGRLRDERVGRLLASVTEVPAAPAADPPGPISRRARDVRWAVVERSFDELARHRAVRRALSQQIHAHPDIDVVCVEYISLAPLLPAHRDQLWSLTLHNLPSEMARHNARIAPGARQRAMQSLQERHARRVEHWAARAYDLVVTVSAEDAALLPVPAAVVTNGVDTARFQPTSVPDSGRVVFTGALHTSPNRDGILWFASEVWPAVRARVPDAKLEIVGSRPPADVLALGRLDGVEVKPDVPDVAPFLASARVAVVPLRIGSGSRLKALEAMASGRPVVGTSVGLGGLELEPGRDALIADEPDALAEQVTRCLTDSELAVSLGAAGRRLVEDRYSWRQIGADYASLLEARIAARTSPPSSSDTVVTNSRPIRSQPKRSTT